MWPLDQPARKVLKLPGETAIPWAVFDWQWYLRQHPEVAAIIGDDDDPSGVLEYYLELGQKHAHAPNRLFDEAWHRQAYPHIVERLAQGHWRSAFDAWCRGGALDRSPHWLFEERAYRERYPALTNDVLAQCGLCNGYDHYLRHGAGEDRIGHPLFDPRVYLSHFDPTDAAAIREAGPFQHYLARIESDAPELRTSLYFDPAWYLHRYPEVARAVGAKRWQSALHHYLWNDTPTAFDPLPHFSESWYLQRDPGLRDVIAAGGFRNGYQHFLRFGATELRPPTATIDLAWYATHPKVRADLSHNRAQDAYTHWLTIGSAENLPSAAATVTAPQASQLHHQAATALLPIAGRFGYRFDAATDPAVSVVMVVRDNFAATMATIASLRSATTSAIELIIVDSGSTDETRTIAQYLPGARIIRFETDIAWSRAADAGRQFAAAQAILFLNANAQIAPFSLDRAVARLHEDATIGAIGGLVLQPHGAIAQAGGIVWNTGAAQDYLHDASPLHPEATFVRDTDFCAPDLLLVRADLLAQLDAWNDDCPQGYEAVDLCLRIAEAGFRVVYDPSVMLTLGAPPSPRDDPGEKFRTRHAAALAKRLPPSIPAQVFARHPPANPPPRRVLFIEDTVPLRRIGSGFVRANDLVREMAAQGYAVTVFPVNGSAHDPAAVYADMPDTVEVMHTQSLDHLAAFLAARPLYYDTVWIARPHNLAHLRPILAHATASGALTARLILDTEAIAPHREAMRARIANQSYDMDTALQAILADAATCDLAVAVTDAEAATLHAIGCPHVAVLGHMIEARPTARPFAQRAGMLFVGAIHTEDSPNLDSLNWFVDEVLPMVEAELKWETRLTIAGYTAPGIDMTRFAHHPRITLRGLVADLDPLYAAHRVFVAPTRYAAGAPYKVLEATARGVPVVATEILCAQLGWQADHEILVAGVNQPERMAAHIVSVYRNETLWQSVREAALRRLLQDHGRDDFVRRLVSVLTPRTTPCP